MVMSPTAVILPLPLKEAEWFGCARMRLNINSVAVVPTNFTTRLNFHRYKQESMFGRGTQLGGRCVAAGCTRSSIKSHQDVV
jgi:hypothetical protein